MARQQRKVTSSRLAKLTPPHLPVVLTRIRLFRLLDHARKRPVTWIAAPAGSGKTTLVASYLKARRLPVCWYRLDETDADSSSFFHFLSLSAKSLAPRFRKPLPVLTPEYALGLPTFARRFFQELCTRMPRRCVMVLDNYQEVPPQSVLHQLLPHAFQELPAHVSVIVMSRHDPPPTMASMQSNQTMAQVGAEPLNLLKSETKALVQLHVRGKVDRAMKTFVDSVYDRVGGWAAGVILTLEHVKSRYSTVPDRVEDAPERIFQYLASEIMERLTPDRQELLLKTSVLSDINVPMAERLSNLPHAGDILMALYAGRYFTERRQGPELSYRYHPLFRDFLLQQAQQVLSPIEFRALQRKAAELLVGTGRIEDGVLLLQAAEDWDGLVPVILSQANDLVEAGRIQTLETWIRSVPESVRNEIPWLNFWLATTRVSFNPDEAYGIFDDTLAQFREQGERVGALMSWCGAVRAVLIRWAGLGRITKLLELFPRILPEGTPYPSIEVEAHVADCMAGAIMQTQPYRNDARAWLDKAVRLADHLPPAMQTGSQYMTEIYYLWLGDIAAARTSLKQYFALSQKREGNPVTSIFFHATNATLAWFDSEFDLCRMHVEKARELVNRSGLHVWDGLIISQGVSGELLAGNLSAAEALLREVDAATERLGGIHRAHFEHFFSWFKFLRGDFQEALEHIRLSTELITAEGGNVFGEGVNGIVMAHALHALGQQKSAAQCVERALEIGDRMQSDVIRFGAWILTAQLAFDRDDEATGLAALQKAFAIGEARGLMQYTGRHPEMMAQLCAKALEAGIRVPFVQRMIKKHRFAAPSEAWLIEAWPWPVKIYTLGKFQVLIDGQPLGKKRKTPHRLLDLLNALVVCGGQEVSVSRLMDMLWPDSDGDQAQENLKKSIARLRKLLGVDDVILWQEGKIILNPARCWVDAWAFEACVKEAEPHRMTSKAVHDDQAERRAIALYRGPFLGQDDVPVWAEPYQQELRSRFVCLVTSRLDQAQIRSQDHDVVRELESAIEVDPMAEPFYLRLIPLLLAHSRRTEAVAYYNRCRLELARWVGRTPSSEIQEIARVLQSR